NDEPQDSNIEHIHEEIADVLIYCIMLSDKFGFDLDEIILDKLAKNAQRYPVEFAYGNSNKAN
ncbi:MazG-like family protein, partial [Bifidobacterium angulatum]